MKKALALLCALLLMLTPMGALAAEGDAVIGRGDDLYINSIFVDGDTLYLMGDRLYTYHIGEADMVPYEMEKDLSEFCGEDEGFNYDSVMFADGGKLYAFTHIMRNGDNFSQLTGAVLSEVVLNDDGTASFVESRKVEWPEELVDAYNDDSYPVTLQNLFARDGVLYFFAYGTMSDQAYAMELETMKLTPMDVDGINAILPYTDGKVLLYAQDYSAAKQSFSTYDPATGRIERLSEASLDDGELAGLASNPETGEVFCVRGGEICPVDVQNCTAGEGVADMPLTVYSNQSGVMLGEYYVYASSDGVVIRSTQPGERPSKRLKVYDSNWLDSVMDAYFDFTNVHGDVSVSISRDGNDRENLVEDMLNRQSNVDVYILPVQDSSFSALRDRGFMAELDGSEKLAAQLDGVYPAIRDRLTRDGHIVAIPVQAYCWVMGANERALEKVGLTIDDVPTNWMDFLDFLADEMPKHMTPDCGVDLFYSGMTQSGARWQLFGQIFMAYQNYVSATMDVPEYDTELLRTLLEKLERVDFGALGLKADDETNGYEIVSWSEDGQLFDFSMGVSFGNYFSDSTPINMGLDANTPAALPLELYAAFVNPFSEEQELAIEYLECLAENLEEQMRYNFCPDLTEPIKRPDSELYKKNAQEYYDEIKKQYDEAEPADKQAMEELLADAENWLEQAEQDSWLVSEKQIEWFRANDDNLIVQGDNWLYSDSAGEAYEVMQQYVEGQIDVRQFLQSVEKKARMMQMEGN